MIMLEVEVVEVELRWCGVVWCSWLDGRGVGMYVEVVEGLRR